MAHGQLRQDNMAAISSVEQNNPKQKQFFSYFTKCSSPFLFSLPLISNSYSLSFPLISNPFKSNKTFLGTFFGGKFKFLTNIVWHTPHQKDLLLGGSFYHSPWPATSTYFRVQRANFKKGGILKNCQSQFAILFYLILKRKFFG